MKINTNIDHMIANNELVLISYVTKIEKNGFNSICNRKQKQLLIFKIDRTIGYYWQLTMLSTLCLNIPWLCSYFKVNTDTSIILTMNMIR